MIAIDHAEMRAFAGNMLEVGSWDEYLGDFTILVMSETARHALATRKYVRLLFIRGCGARAADRRD